MTSETTPVSQQPTVNPTPLPWLGVAAIVISAMAATLTGRLNSAGLADVRGGLGVGVDEGAWIITAFSAAQMMIGPIAVWLGFVFTPRRVLLAGCTLFGLAELLLPLAPNLGSFLVLEACAGVGSGVFIPLVGGFIFINLPQRYWPIAIAGYVMNVVLGLNIASALEGWYSEYASWRWIFWQNAILAAPLFASFWFGMPRVPLNRAISWRGDWLGMMLGVSSLAFAFAALDQGDRLDWSNSSLVVTLFLVSATLMGLFLLHQSASKKAALNFGLLLRRNVLLMAGILVMSRFIITGNNSQVSNFLTSVRGLRPLEIGEALLWIALPQFLVAPLVAKALGKVDPRLAIAFGMIAAACACGYASQLTSVWAEGNFTLPLVVQAFAQTLSLTALVLFLGKSITLPDALTFGALFQTCRLFGGEVGSVGLAVLVRKAEQIHSNFLGIHVPSNSPLAAHRISEYAALLLNKSQGIGVPERRALGLLSSALRAQASTLAYADGFILIAVVAVVGATFALMLDCPKSPKPAKVEPLTGTDTATPALQA